MARPCSICVHPNREKINAAILEALPYRTIAKQFGTSPPALLRHKNANHLPRAMVRAAEIVEVVQADNLVDRLKEISRETQRILAESRSGSLVDNETALRAIARLEKQLELEAKLIGELGNGTGTTVNILVAPEWVMIRGVILGALEPYPDARFAVAQALQNAGA